MRLFGAHKAFVLLVYNLCVFVRSSAPPVLDSYERASAVVIARVISIEPFKDEGRDSELAKMSSLSDYGVATLVIEKVYKGNFRGDLRYGS